jgi:ribosomal protein L11 methyltransferase
MMGSDGIPLWRLEVTVPAHAVLAFEGIFEGICGAVTAIGDDDVPWCIEGYTDAAPDTEAIDAGLALAAQACGIDTPALTVEFLTPRDWLAENQAGFEPLFAGRFFIHPSHFDVTVPAATVPFCIDAGTAFGSGTHPTTATCLLALQALAKFRKAETILDLGCGTGLLAFAARHLWPARVLAVDIDPEAVRVAKLNAQLNHIGPGVTIVRSVGYRDSAIKRFAPFDIIVANVLARPLIGMAGDTARAIQLGGHIVLSGLMERDVAWVAQHHRVRGFRLQRIWRQDGWATLVLQKAG